ncbi:uncharacterized protein J3D65DRAFT_685065 [Phyllosticta citribraziliensis]|uniref:Uncharacterized protein n=1 Tax=Phyllosticta citribraziliensis TaxID=989973 RepID=A0ABR1L9L1_9PEZI
MFATMAARAISTSAGSVTVPMTTRFTPPAECKTHWTYEDSYFNSISNGILVQNQVTTRGIGVDSKCFPSGWTGNGRASDQQTQTFSPGACPISYTTVTEQVTQGTTIGVCCYSDFSYVETGNLVGCVSRFPYDSSTIVTGWAQLVRQSSNNMTQVAGPMTMWAQPITVAFEEKDLSLFSTTASSSALSTSTAAAAAGAPTTTFAAVTSSPAASPTVTAPESTQSSSSHQNSGGWSTYAKTVVGVVVSMSCFSIALAAVTIWYTRRKRLAIQRAVQEHIDRKPVPLDDGTSSDGTPSDETSRRTSGELEGQEIYQLPTGPEPAELYGSNWLERYIPSRILSMKPKDRCTIHQLPAEREPAELYGSNWLERNLPSRLSSAVKPQDRHTIHQLPSEREPAEINGSNWLERNLPSRISFAMKPQNRHTMHQLSLEPQRSELYGSDWQK